VFVPVFEEMEKFINFKILIYIEGKTIQTSKVASNSDKSSERKTMSGKIKLF